MNKLDKIIKYGLYLAFILPLVFTSRTMQPWHFGKVVLWQILVEILLVLGLIYFNLGTRRGASLRRLNLLDWLVLIFLGLQFLSAIFGVNFNRSFWGDQQRALGLFAWLHFGVFYFLLRQFFVTKKDWLNLAVWILAIGFVSSLIAWFGKYFSFLDGVIDKANRLSGMIGNPIFLAAYLIIPAFLGLALFFLIEKTNRWRWLALGVSLVNFITLFFTQIRGALVGFMAGVLLVFLGFIIFSEGKAKKFALGGGIIALILLAGIYVFNLKSPYIQNNFPALAHVLDINLKTTTADTRLMAWKIALKSWQQKPILGWGIENFQDAFDINYDPGFLNYSFSETVWDRPHNYPLEILSTSGVLGFAGYLALIFVLFYYLVKIVRSSEGGHKFAFIILLGASASYLIQNSFGIETANSLQLWFWLLAFVSFYYSTAKPESFYSGKYFYRTLGWLALLFIILTPFLVYKNYSLLKASIAMGDTRDAAEIESLYLWRKNAPVVLATEVPFMWEQAIFLTQDLSNFDTKGILDKETLASVQEPLVKVYEENIKKYPQSFLHKFWGGQLYGFLGEYVDNKYYARSDELLAAAWDINRDRQTAALILAKSYLLQGRTKEGIVILEEVVTKNNEVAEPHWFLGLAFIHDGQTEKGLAELELGKKFGITYSTGNTLYLINLYAERKNYDKIIPLYEDLIIKEPNNPQYYVSVAIAYAELGNEEKVLENLNKAVELQPELAPQAQQFLRDRGITR